MKEDQDLKTIWYFWNHTYYNRTKPSRKIKPVGKGYGSDGRYKYVICNDCGENISVKEAVRRRVIFDGSRNRNTSFLCKKCYKIIKEKLKEKKEKELAHHREEKVKEFIDSIERFDDLMVDCEYNTCDILAAHRELLKDDDNRLRTDFMLELICGEEKKRKYLESRKQNEGA